MLCQLVFNVQNLVRVTLLETLELDPVNLFLLQTINLVVYCLKLNLKLFDLVPLIRHCLSMLL